MKTMITKEKNSCSNFNKDKKSKRNKVKDEDMEEEKLPKDINKIGKVFYNELYSEFKNYHLITRLCKILFKDF